MSEPGRTDTRALGTNVLWRRRKARVVGTEPDGHESDARRMLHGRLGNDLQTEMVI